MSLVAINRNDDYQLHIRRESRLVAESVMHIYGIAQRSSPCSSPCHRKGATSTILYSWTLQTAEATAAAPTTTNAARETNKYISRETVAASAAADWNSTVEQQADLVILPRQPHQHHHVLGRSRRRRRLRV